MTYWTRTLPAFPSTTKANGAKTAISADFGKAVADRQYTVPMSVEQAEPKQDTNGGRPPFSIYHVMLSIIEIYAPTKASASSQRSLVQRSSPSKNTLSRFKQNRKSQISLFLFLEMLASSSYRLTSSNLPVINSILETTGQDNHSHHFCFIYLKSKQQKYQQQNVQSHSRR